MTKRERDKITEAIRLIHSGEEDGGDYHRGMAILCGLVGWRIPSTDIQVPAKDVREALRGKD